MKDSEHMAMKEAIAAKDAEIERLKGRNDGDPVARLHNLCDALKEDAAESPFSREEWDRIDAENVRLTKEIAQLRRELAAAQAAINKALTHLRLANPRNGPTIRGIGILEEAAKKEGR